MMPIGSSVFAQSMSVCPAHRQSDIQTTKRSTCVAIGRTYAMREMPRCVYLDSAKTLRLGLRTLRLNTKINPNPHCKVEKPTPNHRVINRTPYA